MNVPNSAELSVSLKIGYDGKFHVKCFTTMRVLLKSYYVLIFKTWQDIKEVLKTLSSLTPIEITTVESLFYVAKVELFYKTLIQWHKAKAQSWWRKQSC